MSGVVFGHFAHAHHVVVDGCVRCGVGVVLLHQFYYRFRSSFALHGHHAAVRRKIGSQRSVGIDDYAVTLHLEDVFHLEVFAIFVLMQEVLCHTVERCVGALGYIAGIGVGAQLLLQVGEHRFLLLGEGDKNILHEYVVVAVGYVQNKAGVGKRFDEAYEVVVDVEARSLIVSELLVGTLQFLNGSGKVFAVDGGIHGVVVLGGDEGKECSLPSAFERGCQRRSRRYA